MPGGCRPARHTARASGELIEPDKVRFTTDRHWPRLLPCSVRRMASHGTMCRARSPRRREARLSRDPRAHSPAAAAVALVECGAEESHPPTPALPASRSGSRRSGELRAARPARRRSGDAYSRAWPYRWDSARSGHPRGRRGWNNCPRPPATNQSGRSERANPAAQSGSDPTRPPLPIAQAPPTRHPRSATEFPGEHLPGNAAAQDEDNAGETGAIRDTRPPTLWSSGRSRQERLDRSHNASGSSAAATTVHATSPKRIRFEKFCYRL